jgi:ABC-2 type transport system permease protein
VARAKIWVVTAREYLERVRTRWFLIVTIFGPILFGVMIFLPPWLASRSKASADLARIVILDATGTGLGTRVAAELNGGLTGDTSRTQVRSVAPAELARAESLATRETIAKETRGYLVLDSATLAGRTVRYAGTNATAGADMQQLQRVVQDKVMALRLERAGLDPLQTAGITGMHLKMDAERITARGRGASANVSAIFAIGVSLLLYMSILLYGQAVLRGVIEEKQTRVAEVVVSSASPTDLLAGKVLGVGAVGLTQLLAWTVASIVLLQVRGPLLARMGIQDIPIHMPDISIGMAVVLLLFFVLGYMFYAALFAAVGATVSNEQDAQQAQMPITLLLVLSVIFVGPVIASPESTLARTMSWLPFSSPIIMPLRMSMLSIPPLDLAIALGALVVSSYVAVWAAARIYRVGLLMYGKRASLAEALRWVRQA